MTARITPKGLDIMAQATPRLDTVEHGRFGPIEGDRLDTVIDALEDVRAAGG